VGWYLFFLTLALIFPEGIALLFPKGIALLFPEGIALGSDGSPRLSKAGQGERGQFGLFYIFAPENYPEWPRFIQI
jgi:hypothetical protein